MELKTLLKKTFIYKLYRQRNINKEKEILAIRNKYFRQEGAEVMQKLASSLNDNNILFWLDYGTLLGYYRNKDFIKHDNDIDIGIKIEDSKYINKILTSTGFKLVHRFTTSTGGLEECYKYKNTCVDVFYYDTDTAKNSRFCYEYYVLPTIFKFKRKRYKCTVKRYDFPISDFVKVDFKNVKVYIPTFVEKYLELLYGKNFMIPDPNHDPKSTETNTTYYEYRDIQAELTIYDEKI